MWPEFYWDLETEQHFNDDVMKLDVLSISETFQL